MKRQLRYLLAVAALAILSASCSRGEAPDILAYDGPYEHAEVLVTVIVPGQDFVEYTIHCGEDRASVEGTNKINASDACASFARFPVRARLEDGPDDAVLCSTRFPEDGELQILGVVGDLKVNTFIDRMDSCGQSEWDELFRYIAIGPSEL